MFQLIARHLLHTLNIIVVESFTTPHHYCPMSVQPLPALTVTIVFPQKDIVTQFCKMADGLIEIIATNLEEIRKLNDAREYIQLSLSR